MQWSRTFSLAIAVVAASILPAEASVQMMILPSSYLNVSAYYDLAGAAATNYRANIENESGQLHAIGQGPVSTTGKYTLSNSAGAAEIRIDASAVIGSFPYGGSSQVWGQIDFQLYEPAAYTMDGLITSIGSPTQTYQYEGLFAIHEGRNRASEEEYRYNAAVTLDINGVVDSGAGGSAMAPTTPLGILTPGYYRFNFNKYLDEDTNYNDHAVDTMSAVATLNLRSLDPRWNEGAMPEPTSLLAWLPLAVVVAMRRKRG